MRSKTDVSLKNPLLQQRPESRTLASARQNNFKTRYNNHKLYFSDRKHSRAAVLAKHIWGLIDCNTSYNPKWHIKRTNAYRGNTSRCNFCLSEKLGTLFNYDAFLLNTRSELITKINVAMKLNSSLPITQSAIPTVLYLNFEFYRENCAILV